VVGTAATALASLGYGRFSLDHLLGRHRFGVGWALGAAALGLGNAGALLATSYRPEEDA
jgi:putative oxidoreductase